MRGAAGDSDKKQSAARDAHALVPAGRDRQNVCSRVTDFAVRVARQTQIIAAYAAPFGAARTDCKRYPQLATKYRCS